MARRDGKTTRNLTRGIVKSLLKNNLARVQTLQEVEELEGLDDLTLSEHLSGSGMFPDMEEENASSFGIRVGRI